MKKKELIKRLENIKGNPDIKFWNGMVEDWMDIQLVECELVKECEEFVRFQVEAEWKQQNNTWEIPEEIQKQLDIIVSQLLKKREWEFPNRYVSLENEKIWYGKNRKRVIMIDGKKRGKTSYDRLGNIDY